MSLPLDTVQEIDLKSAVYFISPDERTNGNAIVGAAKRKFHEEHDISHSHAKILKQYNEHAIVAVTESIHRDYLDGYALKVLMENDEARADYQNGEDGAINFLVGQFMEKSYGKVDPVEARECIERMEGLLP